MLYFLFTTTYIENEGAGEGRDRKGHADFLLEDPQGESRLWGRKVTIRSGTSKFQQDLWFGV